MNRNLKTWLWGVIFGMCIMGFIDEVRAETIATMPNQGQGKIVLTNETCAYNGKTYSKLYRAYNYTVEGYTTEGCFYLEDETVVVIWATTGKSTTMRYAADNFTLTKKPIKYGT
jgi:hypothetical protein